MKATWTTDESRRCLRVAGLQPLGRGVTLLALLFGLGACGNDWQRRLIATAAADHHCPEERVRLVEWTRGGRSAELSVCGQRRVYHNTGGRGGAIFAEEASTAAVAGPPADAPPDDRTPAQRAVRREPFEGGGGAWIRAEAHLGSFTLRWMASPARDAEHIGLTLAAPATGAPSGRCTVQFSVNGVATDVPGTQRPTPSESRALVSLPVELARQLAAATQVSVRECGGTVLTFRPFDLGVIREILRQFDADAGFGG